MKTTAYEFVVTVPLTMVYHIRKRGAKDSVCGVLEKTKAVKTKLRMASSDVTAMCTPCSVCGRKVFKLVSR